MQLEVCEQERAYLERLLERARRDLEAKIHATEQHANTAALQRDDSLLHGLLDEVRLAAVVAE